MTPGFNSGIIGGMTLISQSVTKVQAWILKLDHKTRLDVAKQAALHEKTLRLADSPKWDPRASTLRKLEELIPKRRKRAQQGEAA